MSVSLLEASFLRGIRSAVSVKYPLDVNICLHAAAIQQSIDNLNISLQSNMHFLITGEYFERLTSYGLLVALS